MSLTSSFLAALLPMTAYLLLLWRMDKYDREPLSFVIIHFFWGGFGAVILGIFGSYVLSGLSHFFRFSHQGGSLIEIILFAPFSEEIAKALFLFFTVRSRKFDNVTDGLVYGGAIGLGFGMTENFLYFSAFGDTPSTWLMLVFIRSLFSAVMHCIATGIVGSLMGAAKFSDKKRSKLFYPLAGFTVAIFIHFTWNLSVSFQATYIFGIIFMLLMILFFFFVFKYSLQQESKLISKELLEEALTDLIPEKHVHILSSHLRLRKGWIDEKIRKEYVRSSVSLAFRKMEYKYSSGQDKIYYEKEVNRLRELISGLNISIQEAKESV